MQAFGIMLYEENHTDRHVVLWPAHPHSPGAAHGPLALLMTQDCSYGSFCGFAIAKVVIRLCTDSRTCWGDSTPQQAQTRGNLSLDLSHNHIQRILDMKIAERG